MESFANILIIKILKLLKDYFKPLYNRCCCEAELSFTNLETCFDKMGLWDAVHITVFVQQPSHQDSFESNFIYVNFAFIDEINVISLALSLSLSLWTR